MNVPRGRGRAGKALSVRQPWASLIVGGLKTIETRPWRTRCRGRISIHAARSGGLPAEWRGGPESPVAVACAELLAPGQPRPDPTFPAGAVIGEVEIVDCVRVEEVAWIDERNPGSWGGAWTERDLGDYGGGRWAWILHHPLIARPPVPLRGRLGLFPVPSELVG